MSTVYLASYRGQGKGLSKLVGFFIKLVTHSPYSHTEVCVGNPFEGEALCVSASGMDGGKVRGKTMQLSPERWDILPMPWVTPDDVQAFLQAEEGQPYDYLGAGRFGFPLFLREHPTRWFCTEVAAKIAGYSQPWRFSPADFHTIVEARNK